MAHYVNRRGYWSYEESYRDESGKPRKRRLTYYGRLNPLLAALGVPKIDWQATLQGTPEDRAMAAAERAAEKAEAQRVPVVEEPSRLPEGLHLGPREPVEVEKAPPTIDLAQSVEVKDDTPSDDAQNNEEGGGNEGGDGGEGGHV